MNKFLIAIFFLFFTLSFARTPLTQQENDITDLKLPSTLAEPDATQANQLEKETQHVQENRDLLLQDRLLAPKGKKIKALPLTLVRLRPINRHFRVRSRRPYRLCHHHFRHASHNLKPRTQSKHLDDQIPHGKNTILSSGHENNDDFDRVMFHHGGMHEFPGEWMSFLHQNDEDDDEQKMSKFIIKRDNHGKFGKMKLKEHFYDPLDDDDEDEDDDDKISAMQHEDHHSFDKKKMKKHLHHHHEEEEHEAGEENEAHKEEKKTGGFVRHIRKFLDNYFD